MNTESNRSIPVWDPAVRLFHWTLAGAFLVAYLTEDHWEPLHVNAGYLIGILIVLRLLWGFVGVTLGTFVGVLPGVGPALTVAMLLPLTVKLDPTGALIMFAGIYYGAMYGGSTTSILLNTPGESATC